jgi:G:T-mismatch repair DNA endonuclease (very short patch repair protein)
MKSFVVKQKISDGMSTPENKKLRSENTKKQMISLKSNPEKYSIWMEKQKIKAINQWKSVEFKDKCLNGLSRGRKTRWNNPNSRLYMSLKYSGNGNPFYGKKHSPETIEKLRKATTERLLKFWSSNKTMGFNTLPERKVKSILESKHIEFISPFVLKNKLYDIFIPKYNIIIEVDGCYWHNKGVSIKKMNFQQLRRYKNDKYKDNLAKNNGYNLVRIWEDEISDINIERKLFINE